VTRAAFLLGQTGSGKHHAAEEAAERFGLTLVSIDSMKVYRGMDVGTAKPKKAYRLVDCCGPEESYNAVRFVRDARKILEEVERPLFVGGTILYYKTLAYGLFEGPEADPRLREELVAAGAPALHAELTRVDPTAATKIHPNDLKRLVRAVEVFRLTGEPISSKHTHFGKRTLEAEVYSFKREDLRERIEKRTKRMIAEGLVEEVKTLLKAPWGKEGRRAVGYREVIDHLDGQYDAAEMERLINRNTWNLARHQRMWMQRLPEITWLDQPEDLCSRLS
jgi:tRNA dimethylallyltransferase